MKPSRNPEIGKELAQLARSILKEAMEAPLETKLEAFKLLTPYWIGSEKIKAKPDDDNDGEDFVSFTSKVKDAVGK
jgi:hypothetical protein